MSEVYINPSPNCDLYVYKDWGGIIVISPVDKKQTQPTHSNYPHDYRFSNPFYERSFKDAIIRVRGLISEGYRVPMEEMGFLIGKVNGVPDTILKPPKEVELY